MTVDARRLDGLTGHARHQGVAARVQAAPLRQSIEDVLENLQGTALLLVLDGVDGASVVMATPTNLENLARAGLGQPAGPARCGDRLLEQLEPAVHLPGEPQVNRERVGRMGGFLARYLSHQRHDRRHRV